MKIFLSLISIFTFLLNGNLMALEAGNWSLVVEDEYCYIGSLAIKSDLPENKKRGDFYVIVYKFKGNPETIVQIEAGYDYNTDEDIIVTIDKGDYIFYSTEDIPSSAWTENDKSVIFAMKKGLEMSVKGQSSRGTITNDSYTLTGFTSSYNKLNDNC